MRNQRRRDAGFGRFRSVVFCVLCLGIVLPSLAANAAPTPRHTRQQIDVLFLSSADPDLPDVAAMIEQAETRILDGSNLPVHFSFEYLESSSSFADLARKQATATYLLQKYSGQTFDLVITINEETLAFTEQIRTKLCPDAALLFFVSNPKDLSSWVNREPGRTGVIRKVNYLPTLQLALRQNLSASHVIVVSGSSDAEKLDAKLANEQFKTYKSNLEFQYWTDLQFSELGPQLAHVQPASIILFLDFITDSRGEQFVPARILPAIAKAANAPIYGTFSSVVGGGVVGGSVADLGEVGRVLGNDGARILKGEKPETIPVTTGDFQHYVVDWRQLHRWGFSEDQLPKETEVRYWEYSPWELYRWRILGLSGLLLIETLLIVLLLRNIVRRKRAQEALRRKEEELAEAQRLAQVGNWLWNTRTETLTWSEELYRIHGLDPRLPLRSYKEFERLFTPESRGRLDAATREALQTGSVQDLDLELVREDGGKRWVTARGEAVRDATGRVIYLHGTAQDITERKLADEARLRLASIVESSDDAIISKNLDGIIMTWNQGAEHIFGFTEADAVGQPITILVPSELLQEEETILHNARAGEKIEHFETVRMTKEGKKIDVSLTISPLRDATGRIVGSSRIARDITERKRAEEELRKSEKRFRLMADSAPMLIWLSGPDTLATDFNKAWLEFTGRTVQQELGEGWIVNVHRDDLPRHLEVYADAFEKKERFTSEYRMRRHDGQYRWMLDQSVPRFTDDGTFAGYVGYCFDISDQKETTAARIELSGRFIHAQEAERERIARELHDNINQRLALLANGVQEFEQATSENHDPLQKKQLQELWQLTNEIATDIQHMSHQLHPSKLHYLGLAAAVRELCREFSRQHKFEIECVVRDLPQDLDETVSLSLYRTVQESLHNVVKHSHARHVKVELTRQSSVVELRVSDDGTGFDPEQARDNHGLGLISMRERLRSVGGEFSIWSKPSLGTQVRGTVPATTKASQRGENPAA
jgi:PAS domain S-box-containing protein